MMEPYGTVFQLSDGAIVMIVRSCTNEDFDHGVLPRGGPYYMALLLVGTTTYLYSTVQPGFIGRYSIGHDRRLP